MDLICSCWRLMWFFITPCFSWLICPWMFGSLIGNDWDQGMIRDPPWLGSGNELGLSRRPPVSHHHALSIPIHLIPIPLGGRRGWEEEGEGFQQSHSCPTGTCLSVCIGIIHNLPLELWTASTYPKVTFLRFFLNFSEGGRSCLHCLAFTGST